MEYHLKKKQLVYTVFLASEPPDADKMPEIHPDLGPVPVAGITHRVTSCQLAQTWLFSIRRRSQI